MKNPIETLRVDEHTIVRYKFGVLTLQVNDDHEFPVSMGTAGLAILNKQQVLSIARVLLQVLKDSESGVSKS
jgi:hypothetical protein